MYVVFGNIALFFFKQKTAYELRISDWSSDVCSSDLTPPEGYEDGDGRDLQVYLDQNYTNALGPLHEDYRERAIPMEGFEGEQPLHIFVAAGVDLAISKLGRFTENDQSDIEQLIECGRFDVGQFGTLATDPIDYAVGTQSAKLACRNMVTAKYLEEGRVAAQRA